MRTWDGELKVEQKEQKRKQSTTKKKGKINHAGSCSVMSSMKLAYFHHLVGANNCAAHYALLFCFSSEHSHSAWPRLQSRTESSIFTTDGHSVLQLTFTSPEAYVPLRNNTFSRSPPGTRVVTYMKTIKIGVCEPNFCDNPVIVCPACV